jgi:hypothetical protein
LELKATAEAVTVSLFTDRKTYTLQGVWKLNLKREKETSGI